MVKSVNEITETIEKLFELLLILNSPFCPITKSEPFLPVGESLLYCPITKSGFALPVGESLL